MSPRVPRPAPRRVVLALGSNLGDRLGNLQGAVDALAGTPGLDVVAVSPVYETTPVLGDGQAGASEEARSVAGGPEQPDYLNAVLTADTDLPRAAILDRAHGIEEAFGRVRKERWGPRTLDVDVIVYGGDISDDPDLTLPHPRAHERAFVLAPWHDIEPGAVIPGRGRVTDLLATVGLDGVRRAGGRELKLPA
jgi:2-amino-4-hydroxy-6-hydroxymethyldihydropteridine diphosphokinase